MKTAIIIPARYGSTRFPGKPLADIDGKTMLQRVVEIGRRAAATNNSTSFFVATDDTRIADHCAAIGAPCIMTSSDCPTGSDRVLEAAAKAGAHFDVLISLQGDAPFTPAEAVIRMIEAFEENPRHEVVTPVVRLRWTELDALRKAKKKTPFSGTTAIIDEGGRAIWFSKNIIPAIRKEDGLRRQSEYSPAYQHMGLYAYRTDILEKFVSLRQGYYETLEGLEQLRFIENGISIHAVILAVGAGTAQAGIDSPEDLKRAKKFLKMVK
ncbi:MAG: 3-deoxy-manno-octulosonate cytidylyltransferase [Proteobacteria bacterium]|nr:3-deoxy-manno-octulosonate cytidylyltransferase [Pseudomonadota bacterium]